MSKNTVVEFAGREGISEATMSKNTVVEFAGREGISEPLTELLKVGAQKLIHQAVEAELEELLERHSSRQTAEGKAGVVRNGYLPERELQTGIGPVTVRIQKVRAKTGGRRRKKPLICSYKPMSPSIPKPPCVCRKIVTN